MVDTIRFKIEDLAGRNKLIFEALMRGEKTTAGGMRFVERGNALIGYKTKEWMNLKINSSSYEINYSVSPIGMFAIFEFSIPKYLYGHNLYQAFPYGCDLSHHTKTFVFTFLQNEFGVDVALETIRLMRIDLCLNLYFDTQEQKDDFMGVSEHIFADLFSEGKLMRYDGTAMYKLKEYSFKIYDKGKEFAKHDFKKLKRLKGINEAVKLGDLAQRIARCELTLRDDKISYLFFDDLARTSQCDYVFKRDFNELREHYNRVNRSLTNIARLFNRYRYVSLNEELAVSIRSKIRENIIPELVCTDPRPLYETWVKMREKRHGDFQPSEFSYLVEKWSAAKLATYNNYRAPKPIILETTAMQKTYNRTIRPEVLEWDSDLSHRCFRMFDEAIVKIIKSCSVSDKPITVLRALMKKDPKNKQVRSVYRYFKLVKGTSDKALLKNQVISDKTIKRIKNEYLPKINADLAAAGLPEIGKFKIKAFPATEIDHNSHLPF